MTLSNRKKDYEGIPCLKIFNLKSFTMKFSTPLTICTKKTTTRKEEKEKMMQDRLQIKRMRWKDGRRKGKQINEGDRIRQIGRELDEN